MLEFKFWNQSGMWKDDGTSSELTIIVDIRDDILNFIFNSQLMKTHATKDERKYQVDNYDGKFVQFSITTKMYFEFF